MNYGIASGQCAVVGMHPAQDMYDACFTILWFQEVKPDTQRECAQYGQQEVHVLRQRLEPIAASAHAPKRSDLGNSQFKSQYDNAGGDAPHQAQNGVGQQRVIVAEILPIIADQIAHAGSTRS